MDKKVGWAMLALVIVIILVAIFGVRYSSGKFPWENTNHKTTEEVVDSMYMLSEQILNPWFTSSDSVLTYRDRMEEEKSIDSIFYSMPRQTLIYVASVVIQKYGEARKKCIVDEYLRNHDIYNNLPEQPVADQQQSQNTTESPIAEIKVVEEGTTTVKEAPPTRVVSTTVKDTTIDGKPATITTKVERNE